MPDPIGTPAGADAAITFISGITSDAKVAATSYFTWDGGNPATFPSAGYITLDHPLGARGTFPSGINASGQIVGSYFDSVGRLHGFLYSGGSFTTLDHPLGTNGSRATGINAAGQIVGAYTDSNNQTHGYVYSGGSFTTVDGPAGTKSISVLGINDTGAIVGNFTDSSGANHAFLSGITGGDFFEFKNGSMPTYALGIDEHIASRVVGYYVDDSNHAHGYLYTVADNSFIPIDDPLGTNGTFPTGFTKSGDIVGRYVDNNQSHGFIYNIKTKIFTTLDVPLAISTSAVGISVDTNGHDHIVGSYRDSSGQHGFAYNDSSAFKWGSTTLSASGTPGGNVTYWFDAAHNWTATEKNAFISGLALWSAVANIAFSEAASASVANFTFKSDPSDYSHAETPTATLATIGSATDGSLTVTGSYINLYYKFGGIADAFDVGGNIAYHNIVHEIGHLIGLGHGGPYNGFADPSTQQFGAYDYAPWSIMSYIEPYDTNAKFFDSYSVTGTDWGHDPTIAYRHSTTPMMLDILAAQRIYGAPTSGPLAGGGQIFGFNSNIAGTPIDASIHRYFDFTVNTHPIVTIWDGGVNNTLDLSGWSAPATINLAPGSFSSANGMVNNIAIAAGTIIDHAVGGKGNDIINGSGVNDTITGGGGDDTIDGLGGTDTVIYSGAKSSYSIATLTDGSLEIIDLRAGSPDGADIVKHSEFLQFSDQKVIGGTVDTAAYSGPVGHYSLTVYPTNIVVQDKVGADGIDTLANVEWLQFTDLTINTMPFAATRALPHASLVELTDLYIAYFNRAPDAFGLTFWGGALSGGVNFATIANGFSASPEVAALYPATLSTADFVTAVYTNVLGRNTDSAGFNFWVNTLQTGAVTRGNFVLYVVESVLGQSGTPDAQYLANKYTVGADFALIEGLSNGNWARTVMQDVDATAASVTNAIQLTDVYAAIAANPASSEFVVHLVGVAL